MKRRDFIRTAGIGVSAGIVAETSSCTRPGVSSINELVYYSGEITKKNILRNLENDFLKLVVFSDASIEILDKKRNTEWKTGPVAMQEEGPLDVGHVWIRNDRSVCEQYPGRFIGEKTGDNIRYLMLGRQNEITGKFICNYELENDEIVFKLIHIDEQIPSLVFPPPIFSESLILPSSQGVILRKPFNEWHRQVYKLFNQINMRWFGGLKGENGWMMIFEDGWADTCITGIGLTLSPGWLKSMNQWTPRSLRICFTENNYVGMAKRYRKWAMDHGLFKSLKEKSDHLPHLKNLFGGRCIPVFLAYAKRRIKDIEDQLIFATDELKAKIEQAEVYNTFQEAGELFEKMKKAGLKKGALYLRGWMNGGFDASHPDVWPPEPLLGSIDELKKLCSEKDSYFTILHDNYQDIYETSTSFPKGININLHGRYMAGGIWSERQCYILNSKNSLEYAKRNWENLKTLDNTGMYIDTTTVMQLFESYEEGNTQTRLQDYERKSELLKFYYDQGMVLGSEQISELSVLSKRIPLWHLVFHDACLIVTSLVTPRTEQNKKKHDKRLEDMLYGTFIMSGKGKDSESWMIEQLKNTLHVDQWHEQIATDEMLSHRFLTDDFMVEETQFSSGKKIICNFDNLDRVIEGRSVKANDYIILT